MSNDDKKWSVYVHTNKINGKKYVGITSRKPEYRWKEDGSGYKGQSYFWNAIQKYGWDNFKHEILLKNETKEYACLAEKCLIKHYKTYNRSYGYNITLGGEGRLLTKEQKKELSEKSTGELNWFYGKKHTEETRKIMSEKAKMRDKSTLNLDGLKLGGVKSYTEESFQKLSESVRGEKSGTAKLTEKEVINILTMLTKGCFYSEIRDKYNISNTEISRIKNKIRWGYLYDKFPELYNFPNIPKIKINSNNKSGVIGVSKNKKRDKWISSIVISGKYNFLGYFNNKDDAIKSRLNAELKYFGNLAPQRYLFDEYGIQE